MFTSIKQILLMSFILLITLFLFSAVISSQVFATPISANFYDSESIQTNILDQMITKFNPKLTTDKKEIIIQSIIAESQNNDFDPLLIASVIAAESSFRPKAVSPCQARGLMQITDCVSQIMNISNPFDIRQNIHAGTRYLKSLYQQFEHFELFLAAYNAGPTRVARLGRVPRIKETIDYIQRVSRFYHDLRDQLLIAVNTVISQPIFNPLSSSMDNSETPIVAVLKADQIQEFPLILENHCCEPDRSIYFMIQI